MTGGYHCPDPPGVLIMSLVRLELCLQATQSLYMLSVSLQKNANIFLQATFFIFASFGIQLDAIERRFLVRLMRNGDSCITSTSLYE
jgi:hypothetical protein